MTTERSVNDEEQPEIEPTDVTGEQDVEGHSLVQSDFHRQIATSRTRESVEWTRPGASRKIAKNESKGRSGR
jgi:hypothetical protein